MKNLLLVACLAALLSWGAAYPVIRLERIPITTRISVPMALRICGWNARCLLNQEIIGIENEEVQRTYAAVIQLAILHELSGLVGHPGDSSESPADSSSEETPDIRDPETRHDVTTEIVDPETRHNDTPEVQDSENRSDSDDVHLSFGIRVIAIPGPFGTRRIIAFSPRVMIPATGVADSDENDDTPAKPNSSDESKDTTPENDVRKSMTPKPTPEASPEVTTTEMTNSIEKNSRGSTTESTEDERRESMGDSAEDTDQVEVFDPKKPARITSDDRFKYKAVIPEIRQV